MGQVEAELLLRSKGPTRVLFPLLNIVNYGSTTAISYRLGHSPP